MISVCVLWGNGGIGRLLESGSSLANATNCALCHAQSHFRLCGTAANTKGDRRVLQMVRPALFYCFIEGGCDYFFKKCLDYISS